MVQSLAKTVGQYLAELPEPRRALIASVRDMVNRHIPQGYREAMSWGMIGWGIPLERYPNTYNGQPLAYVALAAQKRHNALYLMCVYSDSEQERGLRAAYAARGLKLDMGKCCLRFSDRAPPPEDLLGPLIASLSVEDYIAAHEAARALPRQKPATAAASTAATAPKSSGQKPSAKTGKAATKPATPRAAAAKQATRSTAASKTASKAVSRTAPKASIKPAAKPRTKR